MNPVISIARKEFADGLRNRWLIAITLVFALLAVGIAWFGAAVSGQVGFTSIPATIASLASLATFLVPLIALLLAYDAIVGEDEAGTLLLLLTYPLGRGHILLGKFVGHGLILALAMLIGFGSAAVAIALLVEDVELALLASAFARFVLSSMLLGWIFLALAYVLSSAAKEKSSAAGLALGAWFVFVLVFDLALLGVLVIGQDSIPPALLPWLLLANPTDLYRLINLGGFGVTGENLGVLSLGAELPFGEGVLWGVLLIWAAGLLICAWRVFARRIV